MGCLTPLSADATTSSVQPKHKAKSLDIDSDADGGSVNSKTISVESPTNNQGNQHTSTSTPGGTTSVQNALCRRTPVCRITQKVIVVAPGKAKETVQSAESTATPQEADPPEPEIAEALNAENAIDPEPERNENLPIKEAVLDLEMALLSRMIEDVRSGRPTTDLADPFSWGPLIGRPCSSLPPPSRCS
ncbi:hypothetical protein [Nonomuraea sp. NPDC049784]|uniref:hypothetical protein n=1 Tax=Nonomuraea sp. NPDC049784 TaxID=3154361 RepID=UPI0033F3CE94